MALLQFSASLARKSSTMTTNDNGNIMKDSPHRDRNIGLVVARIQLSTEPENRVRCILAARQQHIILRRVNDWISRAVSFDMAILQRDSFMGFMRGNE